MPTPAERQALLFVAAVAVLGLGVRGWRAIGRPPPPPTDQAALARQLAAVDSAVSVGGARRAARGASSTRATLPTGTPGGPRSPAVPPPSVAPREPPVPAPAGPIDMDVASAAELDRLPGIGPALAKRIVEDREANGPFGSLSELERVRGVGPVLVERLQPHVTFSLPPRHSDTEPRVRVRGRHP